MTTTKTKTKNEQHREDKVAMLAYSINSIGKTIIDLERIYKLDEKTVLRIWDFDVTDFSDFAE